MALNDFPPKSSEIRNKENMTHFFCEASYVCFESVADHPAVPEGVPAVAAGVALIQTQVETAVALRRPVLARLVHR